MKNLVGFRALNRILSFGRGLYRSPCGLPLAQGSPIQGGKVKKSVMLRSLVALSAIAMTVACNKKSDSENKDEKPATGLAAFAIGCDSSGRAAKDGPWIDPGTNGSDCDGLSTVYNAMKVASLKSDSGSQFEKIFGASNGQAALQFLNQRVHYIVPNNVSFKLNLQGQSKDMTLDSEYVVAVNMGTALFLIDKQYRNQLPGMTFSIGSTPVTSSNPATGFIQLGKNFAKFPLVDRMATLIHEARHSDCESTTSELCGLPHIACPAGHALATMMACEDKAIGPYYIEAVYLQTLAKTCSNCNEEERQRAELAATDSLSRVMNLADIKSGKEQRFKINLLPGFSPESQRESLRTAYDARRAETR